MITRQRIIVTTQEGKFTAKDVRQTGDEKRDIFPASVKDAVLANLDNLPGKLWEILKVCSCVGFSFSYHLLSDTIGNSSDLRHSLKELSVTHKVFDERDTDDFAWRQHAMLEAVHGLLLDTQKNVIHERIASALELQYGTENPDKARKNAPLKLIAHHWEAAGNKLKAVQYMTNAAHRAQKTFRLLEAIYLYERAIAIAKELQTGADGNSVEKAESR